MEHMTENPPAVVEEDVFVVRRTIRIAAPVERVWAAVTEPPQHISRWFGLARFEGTGAGATGTITFPRLRRRAREGRGRRPAEHRDVPLDQRRRLGSLPGEVDDERSTVFTFTLVPVSGGTELTVVESGFEVTSDPAKNLASHREGWTSELDKLVALLEGGA